MNFVLESWVIFWVNRKLIEASSLASQGSLVSPQEPILSHFFGAQLGLRNYFARREKWVFCLFKIELPNKQWLFWNIPKESQRRIHSFFKQSPGIVLGRSTPIGHFLEMKMSVWKLFSLAGIHFIKFWEKTKTINNKLGECLRSHCLFRLFSDNNSINFTALNHNRFQHFFCAIIFSLSFLFG